MCVSSRQTVIWLGVGGLTLHVMPCTCEGYKSTAENKTFCSYVKRKVMLKKLKTTRNDAHFCHVLVLHCDFKNASFLLLDFSMNQMKHSIRCWSVIGHGTILLVSPLKTSFMDSVTAYI